MKKYQNIVKAILLVLPLFFLTCKGTKESSKEELLITMRKTECLGTCPVYSFKIYANGLATIAPKQNAIVAVPSQAKLSKQQLKTLNRQLEKLNIDKLKTEYDDKLLMDVPTTYLTFYTISPKKEIKARVRTPESLKSFIKELEILVKTINWKPVQ